MSKTKWMALPAAVVFAATVSSASAHMFLLSRGTSVVERDRIVTTLQINAEDFLHYGYFRAADGITPQQLRDAVAAHGNHLTERFIIRDADGNRLLNRLVKTRFEEPVQPRFDYRALRNVFVEYKLESALEAPPRYLTYQQTFGAGGPSVRAQLMLQVRSTAGETERFITLTSGGNVETLAFPDREKALSTEGASAPGSGVPNVDDLKSVRVFVYIDDDEIRLKTFIPVTLVETWMPIPRADLDFLDPSEMNAARAHLLPLFADRNQLSIDGKLATPESIQLDFLAPEATGLQNQEPPRRLSAWTARVGASLRYKVDSPPQEIELLWRLFNGAVLTAHATVVFKKERHDRPLTTYQPTLIWQRPSQ